MSNETAPLYEDIKAIDRVMSTELTRTSGSSGRSGQAARAIEEGQRRYPDGKIEDYRRVEF